MYLVNMKTVKHIYRTQKTVSEMLSDHVLNIKKANEIESKHKMHLK